MCFAEIQGSIIGVFADQITVRTPQGTAPPPPFSYVCFWRGCSCRSNHGEATPPGLGRLSIFHLNFVLADRISVADPHPGGPISFRLFFCLSGCASHPSDGKQANLGGRQRGLPIGCAALTVTRADIASARREERPPFDLPELPQYQASICRIGTRRRCARSLGALEGFDGEGTLGTYEGEFCPCQAGVCMAGKQMSLGGPLQ